MRGLCGGGATARLLQVEARRDPLECVSTGGDRGWCRDAYSWMRVDALSGLCLQWAAWCMGFFLVTVCRNESQVFESFCM